MKNTFTSDDTKVIKGLAILLLLAYHLFTFPDRFPANAQMISVTNLYPGINSTEYIGKFGHICVALFMFLGGYGTWKVCAPPQTKSSIFDKILQLYFRYWKIFVIFVPIGFLFFSNQEDYCASKTFCHVFEDKSLATIINNFIANNCSYNREWWFLKAYIIVLMLFPLMCKIINKFDFPVNFWIVTIYGILLRNISTIPAFQTLLNDFYWSSFITPIYPVSSVFWMGCVFAKADALNYIQDNFTQNVPLE